MQLDGADPAFLYSHLNDLPFMRQKIRTGVSGILNSYWSSSIAWTSFWTGQPPSAHGIHGFWSVPRAYKLNRFLTAAMKGDQDAFDSNSRTWRNLARLAYRFPMPLKPVAAIAGVLSKRTPRTINNRTNVKCPLAHQIMQEHGLKVGLVNCIYTYPPWDTDAYLIADWTMPVGAADYYYPDDIGSYLQSIRYLRTIDESKQYYGYLQGQMSDDVSLIYDHALQELGVTKQATVHLMDNYDWDFHATLFRFLDIAQHVYVDDEARLLRAYRRMDNVLAEVADTVGLNNDDTYWLINSDHGAVLTFPGSPIRGGHDPSGFYCLTGCDAHYQGQTKTLRIEDLMPTVLYLYGITMKRGAGKSARELFRGPQSTDEPDTGVAERLKALGYLN